MTAGSIVVYTVQPSIVILARDTTDATASNGIPLASLKVLRTLEPLTGGT